MGISFKISLRKSQTGFPYRSMVSSYHCRIKLQGENSFHSVLRGALLKERIIAEQFSRDGLFYGEMKQCNIMQIIAPFTERIKVGRNLSKYCES